MHPSLKFLEHRPWPLARGSWIMAQTWHDLLFAHWPVAAGKMREIVPRGLQVDTFDGQAWIGVVPFTMSGVRLRGTPALPWLSAFPELNVRTYVTAGGKPGVWFFSLDAARRAAVETARVTFHLPYFFARMNAEKKDGEVAYASKRMDRRGSGEKLRARYGATGEPFEAKAGKLEHFLTERYCLYARKPDGKLLRGEIHHAPWQLQPGRAEFTENTMTKALGLASPGEPLLHFAKLQEVIVWAPEMIRS